MAAGDPIELPTGRPLRKVWAGEVNEYDGTTVRIPLGLKADSWPYAGCVFERTGLVDVEAPWC